MKTIEELKAEQEKELEELRAKHDLILKFPAPLQPWFVHLHTIRPSSMSYRGKIPQIQGMVEALPAIPQGKVKANYLNILPVENGPYLYSLTVREGVGFGPEVCLEWFTQNAEGTVAHIHLDLMRQPYQNSWEGAAFRCQRNANLSIVQGSIKPNQLLQDAADELIPWATGCGESVHHEFLFKELPLDVIKKIGKLQ